MGDALKKMAYVVEYDPWDIREWSGIGYFMARAFESGGLAVTRIGPLEPPWPRKLAFRARAALQNHVVGGFFGFYSYGQEPALRQHYASAGRKVLPRDADVVFSPGSIALADLESDRPMVFWTDATFAGVLNFYPVATRLCHRTIHHGNEADQKALDRCTLAIYSSDWAARTAQQHYGIRPEKIAVVPFGANLHRERGEAEIAEMVQRRSRTTCELLFVGVDWYRKGGDVAVSVAAQLNAAGLPTRLTIAGVCPKSVSCLEYVRYEGRIDKASSVGEAHLTSLLSQAHFLLLPTRADCTPIVLAEANAYGVPCLTTGIGGIPTMITDGENGFLHTPDTPPAAYCDRVQEIFIRPQVYRDLAMSSYRAYRRRLNWKVSGQLAVEHIRQAINN